jgi:hypothetical protein
LGSINSLGTRDKNVHLVKSANKDKNEIMFAEYGRNLSNKIHGDGFPRLLRDRESLEGVKKCIVLTWSDYKKHTNV